jgi:hypothetical protein
VLVVLSLSCSTSGVQDPRRDVQHDAKRVRCLRVAIGSCRESSGTRARVITTLRARDVGKVSSAFESIGLRTSTTTSSRKGDVEWLRVGVDVVVERDREVGCHVGSRLQQRCAQS